MPDLKLDFKNLGAIHLMPLDEPSLFVPFGRPIADYVRGLAENQDGTRELLKQGSIEFLPQIRWTESISRMLVATGLSEVEKEGIVESAAISAKLPSKSPAKSPDPAVAGFLSFDFPWAASKDSSQAKMSPAIVPAGLPLSKPRIAALPLRPRMTFGPPPAAKAKPAAKAAPVVAPPKPSPVPAAKPAPPAAPAKVSVPAAIQPKPVTVIPAALKPSTLPASATRVALPPKINTPPAPATPPPTPIVVTSPRIQPPIVSMLDTAVPVPPPPAKAPATPPAKPANAIIISPKPPAPTMPAGRAPAAASLLEPAPASEVIPPEAPKENEPIALRSTFEPHLSLGAEAESGSFLSKIPLVLKIGLAIVLLSVAGYFVFGKTENTGTRAVAVGEQGWSTEWASDAAGSRRGRQLTLYRPSVGMSDYQLQFVGQIESKALGWIFREVDTKNYYGMKIENIRPGAMAIAHFAVVEGRESSSAEKAVGIDARPGAAYRVKLDVNGPRFTIYIEGEPVDFWTDNRLKSGSVGFMNERDERGATSSVQFSFAKGAE